MVANMRAEKSEYYTHYIYVYISTHPENASKTIIYRVSQKKRSIAFDGP